MAAVTVFVDHFDHGECWLTYDDVTLAVAKIGWSLRKGTYTVRLSYPAQPVITVTRSAPLASAITSQNIPAGYFYNDTLGLAFAWSEH